METFRKISHTLSSQLCQLGIELLKAYNADLNGQLLIVTQQIIFIVWILLFYASYFIHVH